MQHASPSFQSKTGQLHAVDPLPFPKEKTETNQLHADLLGCCVRKHGGSWSLDLPPEPAATMAAAHTSLIQAKSRTQPAGMPLSISVE